MINSNEQHGMVVDWLGYNAGLKPNQTALIELPSGRRQSYVEAHERVGRVATWLSSLGVGPGDRVGVLALNSMDTLDIVFATWRLGAVHLALNFRLTAPELDYIIGNAEPMVMIYDQALSQTVDALTVQVPHVIETQGEGGPSAFESAIIDLRTNARDGPADARCAVHVDVLLRYDGAA